MSEQPSTVERQEGRGAQSPHRRPILIAYDGSPDAQAAINSAGRLFPHRSALVVTIWERELPLEDRTLAQEGAALAERAGMPARAFAIPATEAVWTAIERVADEHDAVTIVVGTFGAGRDHHHGIRAMLPGSVAAHLIQFAGRPVFVVPPTDGDSAGRHPDRRFVRGLGRRRAHASPLLRSQSARPA